MFTSTARSLFLDYFGVPYTSIGPTEGPVQSLVPIEPTAGALYWATPSDGGALEHTMGEIPVFARMADSDAVSAWLAASGRSWTAASPIRNSAGSEVAAVWRAADGSVFLPFDPAEAMTTVWSERYRAAVERRALGALKSAARRAYYRARPVLPRPVQIAMRRAFSSVQGRSRFPRWPVEPALHDLYDLLLSQLAEVAGRPVPWLSPWPSGRSWSLVLSHDVETAYGVESIPLLADRERAHGYTSSWNFVPHRYSVSEGVLEGLRRDGFEIGVHGLKHDGRDLESLRVFRARLPQIRAYAERWKAVGFRSPATHRVWDWMPELGFEYDSSYPDTDPYEPQEGGCCTWLPFFNRDQVELPITVPQDHTLFRILKQDASIWVEKTDYVRNRGGMALLVTHPDYMTDDVSLGAYERYLARYADDQSCWRALPLEVARWWRRRADSRIERAGTGWSVAGPAADEATVMLTEPPANSVVAIPTRTTSVT